MRSDSKSDYLRYQEVAEIYGISLGTLYSMVSQRKIPHVRLGSRFIRFSRTEIENFFKVHHVAAIDRDGYDARLTAKNRK